MQSEAEWWWCRSHTTVTLFVFSIALASFTSDECIYTTKIIKVVFIRRVLYCGTKRLSIRNFRPPHSTYSAVFQIGKKKMQKILLHFIWTGVGGWRSLSAWPTKICIPAALHWQALKWHQSSRLTLCQRKWRRVPKMSNSSFDFSSSLFSKFFHCNSRRTSDAFPLLMTILSSSVGRLVVFMAFWDWLPSLSSF